MHIREIFGGMIRVAVINHAKIKAGKDALLDPFKLQLFYWINRISHLLIFVVASLGSINKIVQFQSFTQNQP
jgi:hypothetical protein